MGAGTAGLIGMGVSALTQGLAAGESARRARNRAAGLKNTLNNFENSRDPVVNPYAGVTDLSDLAKDLSDQISNPYAQLGVATQAAEIQAEEADIALANTLDTLRATGASAGGATALAQAAMRSKKGVAASIEQQESQNEKLRAQGQQQMEQLKMQEQQRLQGIDISEGQRTQSAEAQGLAFQFSAQEARDNSKIQRLYNEQIAAQNQMAQSQADTAGSISGAFGALTTFAGTEAGIELFG